MRLIGIGVVTCSCAYGWLRLVELFWQPPTALHWAMFAWCLLVVALALICNLCAGDYDERHARAVLKAWRRWESPIVLGESDSPLRKFNSWWP